MAATLQRVASAAALLAAGGGRLEALELAPHRAAYSLSLAATGAGGGVTGIDGALAIEWRADCVGWLSSQRITYSATTQEGSGFATDVSFSSWESRDGRRLKFSRRTFEGGKLANEDEGEALAPAADVPGEARYRKDTAKIPLPPGTVFPTTHIMRLIAAARGGDSLMSVMMFDGSGMDALSAVTAVMGRQQLVSEPGRDPIASWPVSMAYHDPLGVEVEPRFQLSFLLAADGVLRRLVLDYGDFVVDAELQSIERLEEPRCG